MGTVAQTSFGYAKMSQGWTKSNFGDEALRMMALCEVINYKGGKLNPCPGKVHHPKCSHSRSSPHVRCEEDNFCITRYIFLFDPVGNVDQNLYAANLIIPNILRFSVHPEKNTKLKISDKPGSSCPNCQKTLSVTKKFCHVENAMRQGRIFFNVHLVIMLFVQLVS